ncbi:hypothetical protein IG631_23965 [Alternaria alternata]|nr:hypothetical protein IG631_23965 [Alternaria alternata]
MLGVEAVGEAVGEAVDAVLRDGSRFGFAMQSPGFLLLGFAYAAAIRGHTLLEQLVREQGPMLDFDLTLIRSTLPQEGMPRNFRLAPREESLDVSTLRESLGECLFFKGESSPVGLDVAENWFVEGL